MSKLWDSGWTLALLSAVVIGVAAVPLLAPAARTPEQVADVSAVVATLVLVIADLLLYVCWRLTGGSVGWLVLGLTALSVQSLALAGLVATNASEAESHPAWIMFVQIVVAIGLYFLVAIAPGHELRVDPALAGALIGVAVAGLRLVLVMTTDPLSIGDAAQLTLSGVVLAIDLSIAFALFRLTVAPGWVRLQLGLAMTLFSIGHAIAYPVPRGVLLSIVTTVTYSLGATLFLSLAFALVRMSVSDNREALALLQGQLERAEAEVRVDAARLHELRATVAGLSSASRLIHESSAVSDVRRAQIESMMDSEMARLQRLLNDEAASQPRSVDLDATIAPIVERQLVRGCPIRWRPSGLRAIARADDVAEIVNVLLENAFQHAPRATAWINTRHIGQTVEIAVTDFGPGVDRSVRPRIFEWGERSTRSSGSGIGLNVAQQLTSELGGYLRLVDSPAPGATFVLGLPAEVRT